MSPLPGKISRFNWSVDNWGANPASTLGTAIAPGASSSWGSWLTLLSALAEDTYALQLRIHGGAVSSQNNSCVMELGIDPAGGVSYTSVIGPHVIGGTASISGTCGAGLSFLYPLHVPAGANVGCRMMALYSAPVSRRVCAKAYGKPTHPETIPFGTYAEVLGCSPPQGTSFTPGSSADGSWVDLGATSKDLWWWQVCYQIAATTITAEYTYIDLAWGDASNKHIISRIMHLGNTSEQIGTPMEDNMSGLWECFQPVPAGGHIYVRGRCNGTPDAGYEACAVGIGG